MSLSPRPTPRRPQPLERFRLAYAAPVGRAAAGIVRVAFSATLLPVLRALGAGLRGIAGSAAGRALGAAARGIDARRRAAIRFASRSAAQSRAFCRFAARAVFLAPATMLDLALEGLEAGSEALRRTRRIDGLIAALFLVAALAPALGPQLGRDATLLLTRDNPFVDRVHARAERDVSMLPPSAPTVWSGVETAQAERDIAPEWVTAKGESQGPLDAAIALATPPRVLEVEPAPLWSPSLAAASAAVAEEYANLETATVFPGPSAPDAPLDRAEVAALEIGAIDIGPVAPEPVRFAAAPAAAVASGHYATASIGARQDPAWPTGRRRLPGESLPPEVAEALSLDRTGRAQAPSAAAEAAPEAAPIPAMRPAPGAAVSLALAPQALDAPAFETPALDASAKITLVLTAVGLNEQASLAALEALPSSVALAVAPVAASPERWADAGKQRGHVVLLEIPMEPESYPRVDPGPLTLLASSSADENLERLNDALALAPEVDGVASYLGGKFTAQAEAVEPILAALQDKGLFVLETSPSPLSQLRRLAVERGLPSANSVVSIDKSGSARNVAEGLALLEEQAKRTGHAIGVGVAIPATVSAVAEWARTLGSRGFQLTALRP